MTCAAKPGIASITSVARASHTSHTRLDPDDILAILRTDMNNQRNDFLRDHSTRLLFQGFCLAAKWVDRPIL